MMQILDKIFARPELLDSPPVLLDIGASGAIHPKWQPFAKYAICIAFDADDREMGHVVKASSGFKKLLVYNRIVSTENAGEVDFYLTDFPYCSSTLRPETEKLRAWAFSRLFKIKQVVKLKATTLPAVLAELSLDHIDWFKTDSQGTDVRLFQSLGDDLIGRILVAEFEPGILDGYQGEDKLDDLLAAMRDRPFWMSDLIVMGIQRFNADLMDRYLTERDRGHLNFLLRISPGWGEVTYLNTFEPLHRFSKRDYLLGWAFAYVERQYGFCLELAVKGLAAFDDPLFAELKDHSLASLRDGYKKLRPSYLRRMANKAIRMLTPPS